VPSLNVSVALFFCDSREMRFIEKIGWAGDRMCCRCVSLWFRGSVIQVLFYAVFFESLGWLFFDFFVILLSKTVCLGN